MTSRDDAPIGALDREAIARRDLGHTDISRFTVRLLLVSFLTLIVAVPSAELIAARRRAAAGDTTAWTRLVERRTPAPAVSAWDRLIAVNRVVLSALNDFERTLEDESIIGRALRPPAQFLLTRWLGAGNERVYPGRNGWAFYRPDVEYTTGAGFLERSQIRRRIAGASEWTTPPEPDPRPAIRQFARDLAARGITLVVVPVPLKPGVHPEKLSGRYANPESVVRNPSFASLLADLARDGILVFDTSTILFEGRASEPKYLATDTHWRPEAMEEVAQRLAAFIEARAPVRPARKADYRVERVAMSNVGDVVRMLDLPDGRGHFRQEEVWLRRIVHADGSPWRSSRDADMLLLGDSFTNIFSLESMGWGTSAGLAEQLSFELGRPIDRIVQNDEGAFATRVTLRDDPDRLRGKLVVVYQFAERELALGDWKVLPLPARLP